MRTSFFWDVVRSRQPFGAGHRNHQVEREVGEPGGIKSLYSDAYYDPEPSGASTTRQPIRP
jgi:hypothetical protein